MVIPIPTRKQHLNNEMVKGVWRELQSNSAKGGKIREGKGKKGKPAVAAKLIIDHNPSSIPPNVFRFPFPIFLSILHHPHSSSSIHHHLHTLLSPPPEFTPSLLRLSTIASPHGPRLAISLAATEEHQSYHHGRIASRPAHIRRAEFKNTIVYQYNIRRRLTRRRCLSPASGSKSGREKRLALL